MTKPLFLVLAAALLGACATGPVIDTTYKSVSHSSRAQFLVLHYTVGDFHNALEILTKGPVSSHYLVRDDPPTIYQLVDESRTAFHAGISSWKGRTYLNTTSIGIEIVNQAVEGDPQTGHWPEYPKAQIDAVVALAKDIVARHQIRPDFIVGHSD